MDEAVKNCIVARRQVIDDYYDISKDIEPMVKALFEEIEALGNNCHDAGEFESRFAAGSLNQRYMDLFQLLKLKKSVAATAVGESLKSTFTEPEARKRYIKDDAEYLANTLTQPLRHEANTEMMDKLYETPLVGDLITGVRAGEKIGNLFGKFKTRRQKSEAASESESEMSTDLKDKPTK